MGVDVFDIVAVILGVWFTIRKLDPQGRKAADFPHVREAEFLAWQRQEVSAYQVGSFACFAKVLADLIFTRYVAADLPFSLARAIGAGIDLSWIAALVLTFYRSSRARRRRRQLGIVLGGVMPDPDMLDDDDDLEGEKPEQLSPPVDEPQAPSTDSGKPAERRS